MAGSTAAEKYRNLAAKKRSEGVLHSLTLPSGAVWKLREPPLQQFIVAGNLPASLLKKMFSAARNAGLSDASAESCEALVKAFTADELVVQLEFARDLILYCSVEPKISLDPQNDNELAPTDILPEDFEFLKNWVMNGGRAGSSLTTFRTRPK